MALLKNDVIIKMDSKERAGKLKELKFELTRANVAANRTNAKTKEIKRAISRLITFNNLQNRGLKKK